MCVCVNMCLRIQFASPTTPSTEARCRGVDFKGRRYFQVHSSRLYSGHVILWQRLSIKSIARGFAGLDTFARVNGSEKASGSRNLGRVPMRLIQAPSDLVSRLGMTSEVCKSQSVVLGGVLDAAASGRSVSGLRCSNATNKNEHMEREGRAHMLACACVHSPVTLRIAVKCASHHFDK